MLRSIGLISYELPISYQNAHEAYVLRLLPRILVILHTLRLCYSDYNNSGLVAHVGRIMRVVRVYAHTTLHTMRLHYGNCCADNTGCT